MRKAETIEQRARRLKKYHREQAEAKRAETTSQPGSMEDLFGEVISRYSRADAIADGVLYDISEMAREAGIKIPVAITNGVRSDINSLGNSCEDVEGRQWDMLWVSRMHLRGLFETAAQEGSAQTIFKFIMQVGRKKMYFVKLHLGLGDDGQPVLTFLRPEED